MYIDRRIFYVIIAILALSRISGLLTDETALLGLLLSLPAILIAITFHEFAHAFVADRLGDDTPRNQGRLSLNPLSHLDFMGTIMLIFAGFGWGKPVQIDPRNFNRNINMSVAEAIVAAAGPIMNFILAIIFTIIYCAIVKFSPETVGMLHFLGEINPQTLIVLLIEACISINIALGVFNLIPLPPLDGSKILKGFLPYQMRNWFIKYEYVFYIIFIVVFITGITDYFVPYITETITNFLISIIGIPFGIL